jgi:hypothetical protein
VDVSVEAALPHKYLTSGHVPSGPGLYAQAAIDEWIDERSRGGGAMSENGDEPQGDQTGTEESTSEDNASKKDD